MTFCAPVTFDHGRPHVLMTIILLDPLCQTPWVARPDHPFGGLSRADFTSSHFRLSGDRGNSGCSRVVAIGFATRHEAVLQRLESLLRRSWRGHRLPDTEWREALPTDCRAGAHGRRSGFWLTAPSTHLLKVRPFRLPQWRAYLRA